MMTSGSRVGPWGHASPFCCNNHNKLRPGWQSASVDYRISRLCASSQCLLFSLLSSGILPVSSLLPLAFIFGSRCLRCLFSVSFLNVYSRCLFSVSFINVFSRMSTLPPFVLGYLWPIGKLKKKKKTEKKIKKSMHLYIYLYSTNK